MSYEKTAPVALDRFADLNRTASLHAGAQFLFEPDAAWQVEVNYLSNGVQKTETLILPDLDGIDEKLKQTVPLHAVISITLKPASTTSL